VGEAQEVEKLISAGREEDLVVGGDRGCTYRLGEKGVETEK
jgi:hypothetical protein